MYVSFVFHSIERRRRNKYYINGDQFGLLLLLCISLYNLMHSRKWQKFTQKKNARTLRYILEPIQTIETLKYSMSFFFVGSFVRSFVNSLLLPLLRLLFYFSFSPYYAAYSCILFRFVRFTHFVVWVWVCIYIDVVRKFVFFSFVIMILNGWAIKYEHVFQSIPQIYIYKLKNVNLSNCNK